MLCILLLDVMLMRFLRFKCKLRRERREGHTLVVIYICEEGVCLEIKQTVQGEEGGGSTSFGSANVRN